MRDEWAPHFLAADMVTRELPRINILDLEVMARLKNRVSRVRLIPIRDPIKPSQKYLLSFASPKPR